MPQQPTTNVKLVARLNKKEYMDGLINDKRMKKVVWCWIGVRFMLERLEVWNVRTSTAIKSYEGYLDNESYCRRYTE